VIQITGTHYSYVVNYTHSSVNSMKKLYKAMEINESLSMHRMKKQYSTEVHFYLILNKQYCCILAHQNPAGTFWGIF